MYLFYGLLTAALFALTARPAAIHATAIHFSDTVPLAGLQALDPCSGDLIAFTTGNLLLRTTVTLNGNNSSVNMEANQQEAKGIGSPSGLSYVAPAASDFRLNVSTAATAFPLEVTSTFQASLISPSANASYWIRNFICRSIPIDLPMLLLFLASDLISTIHAP